MTRIKSPAIAASLTHSARRCRFTELSLQRASSGRVALLVLAIAGSAVTSPASAQPAPVLDASSVAPPTVIQTIDPTYPEEALAQRIEGVVVLRLTIDIEGYVVTAEIVAPAGHGMDEAAQRAALGFRFAPARRGEQPVSAHILYSVSFKLPAASEARPEAGALSVRVLDAGRAVPETAVSLALADAAPVSADTDAAGRASFPVLAPGRYEMKVGAGARQASATVEILPGSAQTVELTLPPIGPSVRAPTEPVEVTVVGSATPADKLRHSAEAVTVIDTHKAKQQTADLGEVLARTQGVAVRRDAGLGSATRFSLNGLYDEQIRFFLDGVPLAVAGFPFGIANVPVNFVDRIEIYRGVVPVRFGADALGGAVNLVTADRPGSSASASYQVGSFGTHRVTAAGKHQDDRTGLYVGGSAFLDLAKNDYDVDVQATNSVGRPYDATVPRFHDAYRAFGAFAQGGVVQRSWAERLDLRAGYTGYDKQLQSNP